jgi:mannose-1-phosphate guanylyltransferase
MPRIFPVIMAGGAGTRFWPLSRLRRPKQLLDLVEPGTSMLDATVRRVLSICDPRDVLIVTSRDIAGEVRREVSKLPEGAILAEPVGRNTAPCVGWAAVHVARRDPEGVMVVLPADHTIGDEPAFHAVVELAVRACLDGSLGTIGVTPTRPETGFGYIEVGGEVSPGVHRAVRFVEKPDLQRARQYLDGGKHVWNSGMFVFTAAAILREIERLMPALHAGLREIDAAIGSGDEVAAVERVYDAITGESIDYGIMEKTDQIVVCPGRFGWNDVGSWAAAYEMRKREADASRNVTATDLVAVDAAGCLAWASPRKLVALVGVADLVVVDTEDALLVCPRSRAQDVKKVVDRLKELKRDELL